jgi:ubiquinone/menaquinone biosynthesis C-methylase UbiE
MTERDHATTVNAQYNVAKPGSLPVRIAGTQRRKMFAVFLAASGIRSEDTVLDVGATSDESYDHSNYLETWYQHKARITAVGIDDAKFLETSYPGLRFVRADGRDLPFGDDTFDFAHSSAVLEHVGCHTNQVRFLSELWRVARKGIFVTTPNRWFPIEFHTVLPILHWLPAYTYRKLLVTIGKGFFADEANLNLLSRSALARAAEQAGIDRYRVTTVSLGGWPTNLLLTGTKAASETR